MCEPNSIASFPGLFLLVSGMSPPFQCMMTNYMYRGALYCYFLTRRCALFGDIVLTPSSYPHNLHSTHIPSTSLVLRKVTTLITVSEPDGAIIVVPTVHEHNMQCVVSRGSLGLCQKLTNMALLW